ncbi:hypothetical protein ACFWM0_32705 [Streptomyces sp. NPDC058405]|uniref:hypothetical protein n=1 Tax=Streptomyces sp. NPDC058405 TaxID=3346482 RepID=UPI00364E9C72
MTALPTTTLPATATGGGARSGSRLALALVSAVLAVPLVTAAHQSRHAPFGDQLTVHAAVSAPAPGAPDPVLRSAGPRVEARDPRSGALRWVHERTGHRPLSLAAAPGHAFALWSDGLVTDTERTTGDAVRWHRALPGLADWLAAGPGRAAGVLQPLGPRGRMLAVVTPRRIAAYRVPDGDLRWVLPAAGGCAFEPRRSVRTGGALLVAQPCGGRGAWTSGVIAVDGLGRIVPGRTPLGNELPEDRPKSQGHRPEKAVTRPG